MTWITAASVFFYCNILDTFDPDYFRLLQHALVVVQQSEFVAGRNPGSAPGALVVVVYQR